MVEFERVVGSMDSMARTQTTIEKDALPIFMVKEVRAAHILVKEEKVAGEILQKLKSGDDFGKLASKFSICPSGKGGGDLGWFKKETMVKEFEQAAFSASKGETVGPVKTRFGYHLIRVIDQR